MTERAPYGSHRGGVVRSPRKLPRSLIGLFAARQSLIDVHSSAMPHRKRLPNNKVSSSDVIAQRFQPPKKGAKNKWVFSTAFLKLQYDYTTQRVKVAFYKTEKFKSVQFKTHQGIWQLKQYP